VVSPVDLGYGLASLKLPISYHHFVQCYDADFELDSQGDRAHDNSALRSRLPETYILDALFRHYYPVIGEFKLEYHKVRQKKWGVNPPHAFCPWLSGPHVHISVMYTAVQ
jgi:hypothetical protein